MQGALLKLVVKDKLLYSRKVPVNAKGMAAETPEERERRLQRMSTNQYERLAVESPEERETRLQQMRDRLAAETPEERETRLQQMRDRLAAETPEERETRLQQMRTNQHERLAVETPEERELRSEHYSTRYRKQQSVQPQLPLLKQCSIQAKMRKFHTNLATLDTPTCSTCSEGFPGLHFHSKSNECLRDKPLLSLQHCIKQYTPPHACIQETKRQHPTTILSHVQ